MIIATPQNVRFEAAGDNAARVTISGCYPGYGTTIGNALRRVLLSSLGGAAVTAVKIAGVPHEFATVEGVQEDVVQILLNLKRVRVRCDVDGPVTMTLKSKGEGPVTAGQIITPTGVTIVNPDHVIATVTDKKTVLDMEFEVRTGVGYLPVEQNQEDEKEIGRIAVDAIFTPMRRVNYIVENMRVGKRTDYDKVTLDLVTDGTITPEEAFAKGVEILVAQFAALQGSAVDVDVMTEVVAAAPAADSDVLACAITELAGLSTRTVNVLGAAKLSTVGDLVGLTRSDVDALDGMGDKGIAEIEEALAAVGLRLTA